MLQKKKKSWPISQFVPSWRKKEYTVCQEWAMRSSQVDFTWASLIQFWNTFQEVSSLLKEDVRKRKKEYVRQTINVLINFWIRFQVCPLRDTPPHLKRLRLKGCTYPQNKGGPSMLFHLSLYWTICFLIPSSSLPAGCCGNDRLFFLEKWTIHTLTQRIKLGPGA